ncbi:MAG: outer membrane beta-barrel protein [Candidatus Acidiferrales bacterium]
MLRKVSLLLGFILLVSLSAHAQGLSDKVEVFGGYSYQRFDSSPRVNFNGWELSGQYKFTDWLGGVADFDGHYGTIAGVDSSVHTFLFGPQISWPARVSPFAHVLIGGAHFSGGGASDTSFATAIGGGIDARIAHGFSWRIIQGDYVITRFFGDTQNNARVSTGIVFRF